MQPKRTRAPATSLAQCFGWVRLFSTHAHLIPRLTRGLFFFSFSRLGDQLGHRVLDAAVPDALQLGAVLPVWRLRAADGRGLCGVSARDQGPQPRCAG
jgi:hypothetical protein